VYQPGEADSVVVASYGPRQFSGELNLLTGQQWALAAAALLLGLVALSVLHWPLRDAMEGVGQVGAAHWPEPALMFEPDPQDGPVLVVKRYRVAAENQDAFLAAMQAVGASRRRTGATRWEVYREGAQTDGFAEVFAVGGDPGGTSPSACPSQLRVRTAL
jgi:hypothetical protein